MKRLGCFLLLIAGWASAAYPGGDLSFSSMDGNRDGSITSKETRTFQEKRFEVLDRDHNGVLEAGELAVDALGIFKNADGNRDGKVSRDEAYVRLKNDMDALDKDYDGKVSRQEFNV